MTRLYIKHDISLKRKDPYIQAMQYRRDVPKTAVVYPRYQTANRKALDTQFINTELV